MKYYYVYILTNKYHTVFYTGITSNLVQRIYQHKRRKLRGFTYKYNCNKLVWYKMHNDIHAAISDEKRIKRWKRNYKIDEVNKINPDWDDLYDSLL